MNDQTRKPSRYITREAVCIRTNATLEMCWQLVIVVMLITNHPQAVSDGSWVIVSHSSIRSDSSHKNLSRLARLQKLLRKQKNVQLLSFRNGSACTAI
eukprot:CCRYP_009490-RA/>CCRYP_009490-RA protein AED:0.00 eAED:0.00 QI:170/1/1/1/0/0/2/145/97